MGAGAGATRAKLRRGFTTGGLDLSRPGGQGEEGQAARGGAHRRKRPSRPHFVKARVRVHEYPDGTLAIFHGPLCLARYDPEGELLNKDNKLAA